MWSEGKQKDHFWLEFNTKTLAERQIGDDIASRKTPRNGVTGLEDGIYSSG